MPPEPADSAATPPHAPRAAARAAERLHGFGPVIGLVLLCIAGTPAEQRLRHARQRDERAHPHRLHRHHRGGHVLRDHLRRHRPVGGLDGGADRRLRDPVDERAGRGALGRRCWRWCSARAGRAARRAVRPGARAADHQRAHRALHRDAGHAGHLPRVPDLLRRWRRASRSTTTWPTSTRRCTTRSLLGHAGAGLGVRRRRRDRRR